MTPRRTRLRFLTLCTAASATLGLEAQTPRRISGIHPRLAFFNREAECGIGAVVPFADRLWAITYAPHAPRGSSDKLYEIDTDLRVVIRPESVGGTHANRLVHTESGQLFLGRYAIDRERRVRVIPHTSMFGRLTATARHLTDPTGKVYFATMEEGLYEVDVASLAVRTLWTDEQEKGGRHAQLPGYHGKGAATGQGRLVYANNGDHAAAALVDPTVPSGVLAAWDGLAESWSVVRRAQFTEVTGPGGIQGNPHPASDPLWSIGWDHRSLILMTLDGGRWSSWRMPKASHAYDGAHGWNTEWPRIREIGEGPLLMTMHGMFWNFPREFRATRSAGIAPRSTYLKVVGDFCRWRDEIVLGCDDTARSGFLNEPGGRGKLEGPGVSHSNLWFVAPAQLDAFGPARASGAVWLDEPVEAKVPSEPMLFSGFAHIGVHLAHDGDGEATFAFEVDRAGNGNFTPLRRVTVPPHRAVWTGFEPEERGAWIRVAVDRSLRNATAHFVFANLDPRPTTSGREFAGIARADAQTFTSGLLRVLGDERRTLGFAADTTVDGTRERTGYYELDGDLKLRPVADRAAETRLREGVALTTRGVDADAASVLWVDERGGRWRLPRGPAAAEHDRATNPVRVVREVCTERNLLCAHGTAYELPAANAGGIAKVRPLASHDLRWVDFASYRGLLVLSGLALDASGDHVIRSEDGKVALWVGAIDDLWRLGKPRGEGGPWVGTAVRAGVASDPFLMTGFDDKRLFASHDRPDAVRFRIEIDCAGTGVFREWTTLVVPGGSEVEYRFPAGFSAAWWRAVSDVACKATLRARYE